MAGRPVERALKEAIRQTGGEDALYERIADGETLSSIGAQFGVSRHLIHHVLTRTEVQKRKYQEARVASAGAHADKAGEVLDVPKDAEMPQVAAARNRSEYHRWIAQVHDPAQYGKQEPGVQVNIANLHLDALKATGRPDHQFRPPPKALPEPVEVDAETVPNA